MDSIMRLGKYLFALPFLMFSAFHFMNADGMAGMVPIPGGAIWVYLTGLAMLAAGVAILIGKMDKMAAFLLGVLLVVYALSIHLPGVMNAADEMARAGSMSGLLKDLALAGGAWIYGSQAASDR
jgi:uncharacterized membrane protein YphA (DoxX/SURF4 family)